MKNSEQPIYPCMMQKVGSGESDYVPNKPSHPKEYNAPMSGLTKREYFAGLAMSGLLTRVPNRQGGEVDLGIKELERIVQESRMMADAILAELEKPQP